MIRNELQFYSFRLMLPIPGLIYKMEKEKSCLKVTITICTHKAFASPEKAPSEERRLGGVGARGRAPAAAEHR